MSTHRIRSLEANVSVFASMGVGELRIDSSDRVRGGCEFRLRTKMLWPDTN